MKPLNPKTTRRYDLTLTPAQRQAWAADRRIERANRRAGIAALARATAKRNPWLGTIHPRSGVVIDGEPGNAPLVAIPTAAEFYAR